MKIGFYGSSACFAISTQHSERWNYTSYIKLLSNHYSAEIVHLGVPCTSYWDIILIQYKELLNNLPDIAVFIWPDLGFLFHRNYREIHFYGLEEGSNLHKKNPNLWSAAKLYYNNLYDLEKDKIEQLAAFAYFEKQIDNLPCKVIHLWEGNINDLITVDLSNSNFVNNFNPPYTWHKGVQLDFNFLSLSLANQWPRKPTFKKIMSNDPRCNHIEGDEKNQLLASWIIEAIDDYANGLILNKSLENKKFYEKCLLANQTGQLPLY